MESTTIVEAQVDPLGGPGGSGWYEGFGIRTAGIAAMEITIEAKDFASSGLRASASPRWLPVRPTSSGYSFTATAERMFVRDVEPLRKVMYASGGSSALAANSLGDPLTTTTNAAADGSSSASENAALGNKEVAIQKD